MTFESIKKQAMRLVFVVTGSTLLVSCAGAPPVSKSVSVDHGSATITMKAARGPVGLLLRQIAAEYPVDVVLMKGLELGLAGPYDFDKATAGEVLGRIATDMGYEVDARPDYTYLFAPGYETLRRVSLEGLINVSAEGTHVDLAVGSDTPLYSAFILLGHGLGYTLVADNAIAGALCGEIRLRDVSLTSALEALLQSARISTEVVKVESTSTYTILTSTANRWQRGMLLGAVKDSEMEVLERVVRVALPLSQGDPRHIQGRMGAMTLGEVLPELSAQIGLQVRADADILNLPVNPMLLIDLPIGTVLRLFMWQWLVPEFEFTLTENEIRLVRKR